ncbi:MAG TPA: DUF503 domain-containing protein [Longilinea sp.]|nr:DUF503 domain-containing protein [Longilinea sp.]
MSSLIVTFSIPGCRSLKEKRSRIRTIIARLHREFNLSVAEIGHQDAWQFCTLGCAIISNDAVFNHQVLQKTSQFITSSWPDLELIDEKIETL